MTLWTILQAGLLLTNAVAVLNNERFLEKRGLGFSQIGNASPLGKSIIGGIHAVQYSRCKYHGHSFQAELDIPDLMVSPVNHFIGILIILNTLVIFVKLLFG